MKKSKILITLVWTFLGGPVAGLLYLWLKRKKGGEKC